MPRKALNRGLIVSCQALPEEPLHSDFIMGRMAKAALAGGATGIRANSVVDILEIQKNVDLPIIGIIKKDYEGMTAYITPTHLEVEALIAAGADVIAVDATINQEESFLRSLSEKYPHQAFMADVSTVAEGLRADALGFAYVGTTLLGYTAHSQGVDRFEALQALIDGCTQAKVVAEGQFNTPEMAAKAYAMGAYAVVVGSAITRPKVITEWFAEAIASVQ